MNAMAAFDPSIEEKLKELSSKNVDVINTSGPGFITKQLFKHLHLNKDTKILILPIEFFYPLSNQIRDQITPENYRDLIMERWPYC
jgi:hypothetical protein